VGLGCARFRGVVGGLALAALTSASLRDSMPKWFTIFSYAAAVILLASIMFIPIALVPIWPFTAGIVLLGRPVTA
jgi:hypothetical protein